MLTLKTAVATEHLPLLRRAIEESAAHVRLAEEVPGKETTQVTLTAASERDLWATGIRWGIKCAHLFSS